jgi:hypothetical protein
MTEPYEAAGGRGPRRLDRVLAPDFSHALGLLPLVDLRNRRATAIAEEGDLSYLRRMLHGRIDIIAAELGRRAQGDRSPLVGRLAEILADAPPARTASARHLTIDRGGAGEYRRDLEAVLADAASPDFAAGSEEELRSAALRLADHEREVSELRRKVQQVVDECAAELTRRYRVGEAAVDDLLHEG